MEPQRLVLVVDDDEDIRAALCAVLEEEGYETTAVANGHEALEYLRTGRIPTAILLDLMMPVMDGWQFRILQRNDPRLADIPVVVVTASGIAPEAVAQLGIERCLAKPLKLEVLFEAIASCSMPLGTQPRSDLSSTPRLS